MRGGTDTGPQVAAESKASEQRVSKDLHVECEGTAKDATKSLARATHVFDEAV